MDAVRDPWQAHYARQSGHRWWPNESLVRFLSGKTFSVAVEAGCGNGANLWLLAEHCAKVYAVDGCAAAIRTAQEYATHRRVGKSIAFSVGDIFALPVGDGEADLVVDVMTGQHVPWDDCQRLFEEYRRVLRVGGSLFRFGLAPGTTIKDSKLVSTSTYDQVSAFPGIGPVVIPTATQLSAALRSAGFDVAGAEYLTREYRDRTLATYSITEAIAR